MHVQVHNQALWLKEALILKDGDHFLSAHNNETKAREYLTARQLLQVVRSHMIKTLNLNISGTKSDRAL